MSSVPVLAPSFQSKLGVAVLPGRMVLGRLDGERAAIVVANPGGTVSVHWSSDPTSPQVIRINRDVSSIATGKMSTMMSHDILFVGTPTNLMAYDLLNNRDVFFKDVVDGVNVIALGIPSKDFDTLAIVGGNCSIQGFDHTGEERFWTVTGDNVSALALCPIENERFHEMIVGSEDFQLRAYRNEQVAWEKTEPEAISCLCHMQQQVFGYALQDGTVGVYEGRGRLWTFKYNVKVSSIASFDVDNDGTPELIVGLSDGLIEVRMMRHGTVIYTDNMGASVAAIVTGGFRSLDENELIVCAVDGALKGYMQMESDSNAATSSRSVSDEAALAKMKTRLAELQRELAGYDLNLSTLQGKPHSSSGRVPVDTKISCALGPNLAKTGLELRMSTSNDTLIKLVIIFGNSFEGEVLVKYATYPDRSIAVLLRREQHTAGNLKIKVVVGYKSSSDDHVFELSHRLPKFASFVYCKPKNLPHIKSVVVMPLKERISRVVIWLNQSFLLDFTNRNESDSINIGFKSMHSDTILDISVNNNNGGQFQIRTEDMQLAGDIIQDLCGFLSVENSESVAFFPAEFSKFEQVLRNVDEYSRLKTRLNNDMADLSNLIKALVVKGEDGRLLGDMVEMKAHYSELMDTNSEQIRELNKRAANHAVLLDMLKQVNLMIQRAARLRMGTHKAAVIAACRQAIKSGSPSILLNIIKQGHE